MFQTPRHLLCEQGASVQSKYFSAYALVWQQTGQNILNSQPNMSFELWCTLNS